MAPARVWRTQKESEVRSVIAISINRDASFHRVYFRSTSGRRTPFSRSPILLLPSHSIQADRSRGILERKVYSPDPNPSHRFSILLITAFDLSPLFLPFLPLRISTLEQGGLNRRSMQKKITEIVSNFSTTNIRFEGGLNCSLKRLRREL